MRFGVNTWVWTAPLSNRDIKRIAPKVKELGFDWIEFPIEGLEDWDPVKAREVVEELGLGVSCCAAMGPDRDLIHPDKAIRDNGMAYLKAALDMCEAVGAANLVGPLYSSVGRTWKQTARERAADMKVLVANLKELSAYAGDRGVKLGVEPLNRFETSYVNLAAQAVEIVDKVDNKACGIMLDSFHMNIEEKDLYKAIKLVGKKRLVQFHACENDRGTPGSGNVTWDKVAKGLKSIKYEGPVVIESFTPKVESISRAAAIWRPLADSPEQLAGDGVKFLKKLLK
jgi:D-psicose/D-tagatose/L-ribulose 3-epimerase